MPHVTVNIAGRAYRLACAEGEEAHLELLSRMVESKIEAYRGSFGEIGDQRIAVMAAITLADELHEARQTIETLQREASAHRQNESLSQSHQQDWVNALSDQLTQIAQRLEQAASSLNNARKP